MKRRNFIKSTAAMASISVLPSSIWALAKDGKLRTAHIGIGAMGMEDLIAISSHSKVVVTALCDVDSNNLATAKKMFPNAKVYSDYRILFKEVSKEIDAVIDAINNTGYGLTLGIHSRIDETVEYIQQRMKVGNCYVNRNMIGAVVGVQPFGGEGLSGTGPKASGA